MLDVFAKQIMMICFAISGRQDIYKFAEDINKLTKDPDKKSERLAGCQGEWRVLLDPCKVSAQL